MPMSSFRIYQIDHFDPKSVGQKKRRLVVCIAILSLLFALVFIVCLDAFKINMSLFIAVWTPLYAGFFLYLNYRIRSDLKHIKVIGEIEFTRTCIKKRIGDSFTEYDFQSINKLELQKHFPTLHINDSKSGYFTYILKITFTNFSSESLVVSDKPTDSKLDICIVETMKTLKRIIKPDITIET